MIRGSLGNLIEWYDWYAYAAFSIYFASVFFPSGNQTAQLLNTAGVFAVGFLVRPFGGWMFGRLCRPIRAPRSVDALSDLDGHRFARHRHLAGICADRRTCADTAGRHPAAAGASLGGEYGTSATYLSEVATPHRRGFYSSFQYVTLTSGQLLALGVQIILQQLLTPEQMHAWGWRIAFVIGAAAAVTVMWLRRTMDESENYRLAVESRTPNAAA